MVAISFWAFLYFLSYIRLMKSLPNIGLLVLRCTFSFMLFFNHGYSKLVHFSEISRNFPNPIGMGSAWSAGLVVFAEAIMSAFVFFGLYTRLASIPIIINMGVAALVFHSGDPISKSELAYLYLASFVAIATLGPGTYSLDSKLRRVN